MGVIASDLVVYGSAVMPDDDATLNIGGGIDTTVRVAFNDIVATDQIEVLSDAAGDTTQTVTITGRDAAGVLISDTLTLNGTTFVTSALTFERIMKIVVSAAHTGTVTVRDQDTDTVIAALEPGVLTVRVPFFDVSADVAGGAARTFYEKVFYRNNNGVTALTNAQIIEQADPSAKVSFALESILDGTDTNGAGNNRQVSPVGYTFDSAAKAVANSGNHSPATAQGIWLKLDLAAGDAALKTTYTLRESGTTT